MFAWLAERPDGWIDQIGHVTLDLSSAYRTVADTTLPDAVQVADTFHVIGLTPQRGEHSAVIDGIGLKCSRWKEPRDHAVTTGMPVRGVPG